METVRGIEFGKTQWKMLVDSEGKDTGRVAAQVIAQVTCSTMIVADGLDVDKDDQEKENKLEELYTRFKEEVIDGTRLGEIHHSRCRDGSVYFTQERLNEIEKKWIAEDKAKKNPQE